MRRTTLFALMIALLLLPGCGKDPRQEWERWQEELRGAQEIRFTAEICSLTKEDALSFGAEVCSAGESVTVTLTAPESLRGLSLSTDNTGTELAVEDMRLSLTALRGDTLSPAEGVPMLLTALREGYILATSENRDSRRADFAGAEGVNLTLWRDTAGAPIAAELGREGKTELRLSITDWQTKEQP